MRCMVIVKANDETEAGVPPTTELFEAMTTYNEQLAAAGIMKSGDGLQPSSAGARVHFDGERRTVTDGPFLETKELIAGFWIWEVDSLEQAIEWAKKCPNPTGEQSVLEIRPFYEVDDFDEAFTPELREREERLRAKIDQEA